MSAVTLSFSEKSRLAALLEHYSQIEDPRDPWRVAHLAFLRRFLPYHHGVHGGRWLTILMNRIDPALFLACFIDWVREIWPDRPDFIAIDSLSRT